MTQSQNNSIKKIIGLSIALIMLVGYHYTSAQWTNPPAGTVPPANNTPTPINVGGVAQSKLGNLGAIELIASDYVKAGLQMWSPEYCDENGANCFISSDISSGSNGVISFAGAFSLGSSRSCNDPNPITGDCSCPAGYIEYKLADNISGGEQYLYYCATTVVPAPTLPNGGNPKFGGGFSEGSSNVCAEANPYTGQCNCPAGYTPQLLANSISGGEQYLYYCI